MENKLAENIRQFRKQRKMTQEQLAEVLGVTVGAVHKWEARLSTPELSLIMEMADYFDISVDVLLGYEMKDHRLNATIDRLTTLINTEDPEGVEEAEKALSRFPHSPEIVWLSAATFLMHGGINHNEKLLQRALKQFQLALVLLPLSTNPKISEISICGNIADVQILLGRADQAAELLKQHNTEGVLNDSIGLILSLFCRKPDESQSFLSEALLDALLKTFRTVFAKAYAYIQQDVPEQAEALLQWEVHLLESIRRPDMTGVIDQACALLYLLLALAYLRMNRPADAEQAMQSTYALAERFDAAPNYDVRSVRFIDTAENFTLHFLLGRNAKDGLDYILDLIQDETLTALWKEVARHAQ